MKTLCRPFALFIVFLMIISYLPSCFTTDTQSDGESTPADTSSSAPCSSINLIENGTSEFKVVIPRFYTDEEYERIEKFVSSFKNKTGITLRYISEDSSPYENDNPEILIGQIERKESKETFEQLKANEYFYGVLGNKIVICGKTDFELDDAIQFFFRKVIDVAVAEDKLNVTVTSQSNCFYRCDYPLQSFLIGNTSIENYSIVYSKKDSNAAFAFATKLKNIISSAVGLTVPIVEDSTSPTRLEIVVGSTTRGTPSAASKGCFSMACDQDKLYLDSSYAYGYNFLYLYIMRLISKNDGGSLALENGFSYEDSFVSTMTDGTENILTKNGSVRVIFHNVLIHDRDTAPTAWRARYALDVYRDYAPDVIGLQEMQGSIRTAIVSGLKELGYVEVPYTETNSKFKFVEDPIFYNPKTLTLVTSGAHRFNEKSDKNKCIGWALFEEKATGKRFIVASTHFAWLSNPEEAVSLRLDHARQTAQKVKELSERFNVPLIIGGDFNCNTSSEPYSILLGGGMKDVENLALKTEDQSTHHSEPVFNLVTQLCQSCSSPIGGNDASEAIDHIFTYKNPPLVFNAYDVITDDFALASSDHCPLLLNFTLN